MDLLNFIFRLGVVFAIFGFIWALIELGVMLLTAGRQRQLTEVYILKAVKYFLLVNVTFLICENRVTEAFNQQSQMVFGTIVLLMYFVGKLQDKQNKQLFMQVAAGGMLNKRTSRFNLKAEIGVIVLALASFVMFWFYPTIAMNPLALWFKESILNIEDTPIFGFIFKVIGFFFLISILIRMMNAVLFFLSGNAFQKRASTSDDGSNSKDDFDSYEEVE